MRSRVSLVDFEAVESAHKQNVLAADLNDTALGGANSALFGEHEHRVLDARVIPAIVRAVEFGDPKPLVILDDRLAKPLRPIGASYLPLSFAQCTRPCRAL
jgi:hypothetical protein